MTGVSRKRGVDKGRECEVQCAGIRGIVKARNVGRKPGSKTHKPETRNETSDSESAVTLQPGSKLKILSDIQRYISNPDEVMVSQALAGRLASTKNMDIAPSKLYEDDGHKMDVIRFVAAKCAVSLPPSTPHELYESLEAFLGFCTEQRVPPTIGLFSVWNGITQTRYDQITRDSNDPARAQAFGNAKELIRSFLEVAAMENAVNPIVYFHQQKTMYGMVENQQVTVRVEDNTREISDEEREKRMAMLDGAVTLVQDESGVWGDG